MFENLKKNISRRNMFILFTVFINKKKEKLKKSIISISKNTNIRVQFL